MPSTTPKTGLHILSDRSIDAEITMEEKIMTAPVILIGTKRDSGLLGAVGLYPDKDVAYKAVMSGNLPDDCHYAVMTPAMGETMVPVRQPR